MRAARRPRPLRRGDRVAVVAPSGPVTPDRLERGVAWLRSLGLSVDVATHVLDRDRDAPYLAGDDAKRAADLQSAWCDPGVAAVLCARGGFGAGKLLPHLDLEAMRARGEDPPWLVGSSDITVLHTTVREHLGVATLWGPMVATQLLAGSVRGDLWRVNIRRAGLGSAGLGRAGLRRFVTELVRTGPDRTSRKHLRAALFDPQPPPLPPGQVVVPGTAEGVLVGGTLSLLAAAAGTPSAGHARDAIVLLEDVTETAYRLDRLLTQLDQAGWFAGVRGVVLGSWDGCSQAAQEAVLRQVTALGVPVIAGLPLGHGRPALSVPLGRPARLDATGGTGGSGVLTPLP